MVDLIRCTSVGFWSLDFYLTSVSVESLKGTDILTYLLAMKMRLRYLLISFLLYIVIVAAASEATEEASKPDKKGKDA